jgi:hypothetical protein
MEEREKAWGAIRGSRFQLADPNLLVERASSVVQLDALNSFMATYLNRLQAGGVEGVN